jgi:hypothetical protein
MTARTQFHAGRDGERGQILVIFVLGLVALIAMVGLVLDGGDTFAQRRAEQSGADLAAIAGANAYINTWDTMSGSDAAKRAAATNAATLAAVAAATRNGYTDGTSGASVDVTVTHLSSGARVHVGISQPHPNNFARIIPGQATWDVTVQAAAITGTLDTASGAAPWTMHVDAFDPDGTPKYTSARDFGVTNGDYPVNEFDIAWTDYNGSNNVNSAEVKRIIDGSNVITATMAMGQYIGQHNNGYHNTLFKDVDDHLAGTTVPVPITGPGPCNAPNQNETGGCFVGWAMFHVVSAQGGSQKTITGYFIDEPYHKQPLSVGECTPQLQAADQCGVIGDNFFGAYTVRLSE